MPETFHISTNGEVKGPYLREQIKSMWDAGVLTADALYWSEGKHEWLPVADLFIPAVGKDEVVMPEFPLPRLQDTTSGDRRSLAEFDAPSSTAVRLSPADSLVIPLAANADAWRRGVARFIDLNFFGYLAWLIVPWTILAVHQTAEVTTICGIVLVVTATLEIFWLQSFRRTTPGKWLFGLWIEVNDGAPVTVLTRRTYSVLWRSTLLLGPIFWPLTYRDVSKNGTAKWDRKNGTRVLYRRIGDGREVLGAIIAVAVTVWFVVSWVNLFDEIAHQGTALIQMRPSQVGRESTPTRSSTAGKAEHDAAFAKSLDQQYNAWNNQALPVPTATPSDKDVNLLPRRSRLRMMLEDVETFLAEIHNTPGPFSTQVYTSFQQRSLDWMKPYFPELGIANSRLNREFIKQYQQYRNNSPSYFDWPDWPIRLCQSSVNTLDDSDELAQTFKASTLGRCQFPNNDILFDAFSNSTTSNILTVENGTNEAAIAKLIDPLNNRTILIFFVAAKDTASIKGIPYGVYHLLFAFGQMLYAGTDHFVSPNGMAAFDDVFNYAESNDPSKTKSTELTATLHAVPGGNAKSTAISEVEFENW